MQILPVRTLLPSAADCVTAACATATSAQTSATRVKERQTATIVVDAWRKRTRGSLERVKSDD